MKNIIILTFVAFLISACGGDGASSESSSAAKKQAPVKVSHSKLTKFMLEDTVCNALSKEVIQKTFNVSTEIKIEASTNRYSSGVTCNYSWNRADAAERKDRFMSYVIDQMQGKVKKLPMRQRTTESNVSLKIEEYSGQAERFVPAKLTEDQLQKQIAAAQKRADERLSDKQKEVAGDMANSMMERLLRQNNMNETVDGVGDGAYWSTVAGGGLNVLSGNTKISISLMIGDSQAEDMENAKKIAQLILQ